MQLIFRVYLNNLNNSVYATSFVGISYKLKKRLCEVVVIMSGINEIWHGSTVFRKVLKYQI
jgi:hypothetical protein